MILIADSGSTKTDWCVVENGKVVQQIFSKGINPFYQTEAEIQTEIELHLIPFIEVTSINSIFFYGAGCSFPEKKAMVGNVLNLFFCESKIQVESDLLGAARALLQHSQGIACILGTGSNSCYYNGNEIVSNVSPLGFILGDEGSGAVLSKLFISDCLKNQVSDALKTKFSQTYNLTPALVLDNVYKKPFPNRYLAQFTPFLSENIHQPEVYNAVFNGFVSFFERNVKQYNYQTSSTSFVGSVAFHLKDVLEAAAKQCNVPLGSIVKSPMHGLVKYHSILV